MLLVLSDPDALPEALLQRLDAHGITARALSPGSDAEVRESVTDADCTAVAVITRDDVLALRLTLLCAHLRPQMPLWATIFDRTVSEQLRESVPGAQIVSTAQFAAQSIAEACCAATPAGGSRLRHGVRLVDDALRLLVIAGAGLLLTWVVQAVAIALALRRGALDAVYFSVRLLATVADAPHADSAPAWFKIVTTLDSLAAVALVAVFTAALVRRLAGARLTTIWGARACPARRHVVVVGLGQVGFRLAQILRSRGYAVIAVERDRDAACVRLARRAGIAVMIGRGDDREVLAAVGVRRCAALAAVTSNDLVNIESGLTAKDLAPGVDILLRLGDGEVAAESDSLLHLGQVCDVHGLVADELAGLIAGTLQNA